MRDTGAPSNLTGWESFTLAGMQERSTQADAGRGFGAFARHPATSAILALGITQICAWGTSLYALGVLGKPIAADTGWSQSLVFGGLTVGLLVSSAVSPYRRPPDRPPRRPDRHVDRVRRHGHRPGVAVRW